MRLLFIRHGQPDYQNDCLTPLGHLQAEAAARRLAEERIDLILSSSCGRAYETAMHTARMRGMEVTVVDAFREICWGPEGGGFVGDYHPWKAAQDLVHRGEDLLTYDYSDLREWGHSNVRDSYDVVARQWDSLMAEWGYEREGAYYRCRREDPRTVALFAHAGVGTCLFAHLFGLHPMYLFGRTGFDMTSVSRVDFAAHEGDLAVPTLCYLNDHRHLRECPRAEAVVSRGEKG